MQRFEEQPGSGAHEPAVERELELTPDQRYEKLRVIQNEVARLREALSQYHGGAQNFVDDMQRIRAEIAVLVKEAHASRGDLEAFTNFTGAIHNRHAFVENQEEARATYGARLISQLEQTEESLGALEADWKKALH